MVDGRPPLRPRARAAARPAVVRSLIMSRSNSARARGPEDVELAPRAVYPQDLPVDLASLMSCVLATHLQRYISPILGVAHETLER